MIVPNLGPDRNVFGSSEPAREFAEVGNCDFCPPPFGSDSHYSYCQCDSLKWARANASNVRGFSALAWFTASAAWRGIDRLKTVPLGLVRISKGGTKIMKWSPQDAVATCSRRRRRYLASTLWANMVQPLAGLQFKAAIWMHGASDTGPPADDQGPEYYSCALPTMINAWRDALGQALPFLVVELPAYCNEMDSLTFKTWCDQNTSRLSTVDYHLPQMRVAQTAVEKLSSVFMVTAMDFGSLHPLQGSIHSDRKEELGRRLATALRAKVYGDSAALWQGPKALAAERLGSHGVRISFSTIGGLQLDAEARCPPQVLPVYCTGSGFELQDDNGVWTAAPSAELGPNDTVLLKVAHPDRSQGLLRVRYAFADWPVCSIYGKQDAIPARIFDMPIRGGTGSGFMPSRYLERFPGPKRVQHVQSLGSDKISRIEVSQKFAQLASVVGSPIVMILASAGLLGLTAIRIIAWLENRESARETRWTALTESQ